MVVEGSICCLVLTTVISYTSLFPMLAKVLAKRCQPTQAGHADRRADSCMLHTLTVHPDTISQPAYCASHPKRSVAPTCYLPVP